MAVLKIQSASATRDTGPVFGAPTANRVVSTFNLASWFKRNPAQLLQEKLLDIIDEANEVIENTFRTDYEPRTDDSWPTPWMRGRARYDAHFDGYFTYMKLPHGLPWDGVPQAPDEGPVLRPVMDMTDASKAWMDLLAEKLGVGDKDMSKTREGEDEADQATNLDVDGMEEADDSESEASVNAVDVDEVGAKDFSTSSAAGAV